MPEHFNSAKGGKPFPRTADEWLYKTDPDTGTYFTPEKAEHKMRQDVFGYDYKVDAKGNPIERGKGSAAQPTAQHQNALMISQEADMARKMRLGWHPGMEQAFDPRSAPAPRRKAKRRKTAAAPAEGNA